VTRTPVSSAHTKNYSSNGNQPSHNVGENTQEDVEEEKVLKRRRNFRRLT
jgi:hypothetical protein